MDYSKEMYVPVSHQQQNANISQHVDKASHLLLLFLLAVLNNKASLLLLLIVQKRTFHF